MPRATYKVWKGIFRVCSRLAGHFGDITFLQAAWMGEGREVLGEKGAVSFWLTGSGFLERRTATI